MSIFISYRRDGGKTIAESIYQALSKSYDIFLDTESLKNGVFDEAIVNRIEQCTDFLVIITETVFDRCSEPSDWIFHEAQIALREHKNIIPIFVGVKDFPSNVPEPLMEICRYNGIFWDVSETACEKIKSFLLSNHRCILNFEYEIDRVVLCSEAKEELKELYQRFLKNGRLSVDIKIQIPDKVQFANQLIRADIASIYGEEFAKQISYQSLLKKLDWIHESLEIAFEYMLQDVNLDSVASRLSEHYVEKYDVSNCVFIDEQGNQNFYWTVFLWIDIIEELAKELIEDRYYIYGNSKEFTGIDCFVETKSGKRIWSFVSFILKQAEDADRFIDMIKIPGGYADYLEVPLHSLAFHVYPDLYFNIGQLKANKTSQSYDKKSKNRDVFNLLHYYFGMH